MWFTYAGDPKPDEEYQIENYPLDIWSKGQIIEPSFTAFV